MQKLPIWLGLGYSEHHKLGFKDYEYEKVQVAEETQEAEKTKHTKIYELQPGKTFWDWLQLLIIPIFLASICDFLHKLAILAKHNMASEQGHVPIYSKHTV